MKRSAKLERKTPLRPGEPLRSRKRIKPLNRERVAEKHERNFGEEAERVRSLPCLACSKSCGSCTTFGWRKCWQHWAPRSVAAHVTARGMGGTKGGRLDLVPLCDAHHREAGEAETSQRAAFEQRYGLDLRAEADRIALEHPRPLGIRGLVDRCLVDYVYAKSFPGAGDPGWLKHRPLDTYETKALLGWCRREMEGACMPGVFACAVAESGLGGEREVLTYCIGKKFGGPFEPWCPSCSLFITPSCSKLFQVVSKVSGAGFLSGEARSMGPRSPGSACVSPNAA